MLLDKKIVVILPAFNASKTLEKTVKEIPQDIVDCIILVDDCSSDDTIQKSLNLGLQVISHKKNMGYGANQKTCYKAACALDADIIVMLHPDYQYTPKLIRAMISLIAEDAYDVVLGSRILGKGALTGGMPIYKYVANRFLTFVENILTDQKLSEYHTGYRAFSRKVLERISYEKNSNDFIFDNEILLQCFAAHFRIAEITCPTKYFKEASSISFRRSVKYGFGCLQRGMKYCLHRYAIVTFEQFKS